MASSATIAKKRRRRFRRTRAFWGRVTEGLKIQQLWRQFFFEAKASYGLYSKDVDWEDIGRERSRIKRLIRSIWGLFVVMLMKLSPPRRVLLLVAIILVVLNINFQWTGAEHFGFNAGGFGVAILFVLLALELGDRVTMKRDLEIAREIQQWLVPENPPAVPGLDIAFATRPQNTVAGDYYDAFLRAVPSRDFNEPPLMIAVADVAGKSVPAALLMATFQASLRALAATPASLVEVATGLDRYCRAHNLGGLRFTTAFLAEIEPITREMLYVNAGHNYPILRHASGEIERLAIGGPPFGVPLFTQKEIPYISSRVQLQPKDLLCIFTDGVADAVNEAGVEYGEERLISLVQAAPFESASDTLKRIMENVNIFVGQARPYDDITCLVLRVAK